MSALNTAATGMKARDLEVQVIANNIANLQTTGYKIQRAAFADLLYQKDIRAGTVADEAGNIIPVGVQIGLGVKTAGVYRINEQGQPIQTSNPYDLSIRGNGYFRIEQPDGSYAYTRDGSFRISPNYEIVTDKGLIVTPGIIVPPNMVADGLKVNSYGQVSATVQGSSTPQVIGQLDLVGFPNQSGLDSIGDNLLVETPASGTPIVSVAYADGMGDILQGWLESSNVDPVTEITGLITAQRGYELSSKVILAADDMMQVVNRLKQ